MLKKKNNNKIGDERKDFVLWELFFERTVQNIETVAVVSDSTGKLVCANSMFDDFFRAGKKGLRGEL